jgi:AcrR family transcriptional regulator
MSGKQISSGKIGRPVKAAGDKHTKEKIFDVAVDLFSKHGFNQTSVRMIASNVGLTEGAFYRHYSSKEEVLNAILSFAENFIYTPLPIEQTLGDLKGDSIFRGLLSPLPEIIIPETVVLKIIRIIYNEMPHNEKIRQYFQREYIQRADEYLHELFKKCIEKGTIKPCDPMMLAKVFNAFRSDWAFQNFIIKQDGEVDIEAMRNDLLQAILFFENNFLPER